MKKLIFIFILSLLFTNKSYANYQYKANYEFYYNGELVELNGNYYENYIPVYENANLYKLGNNTVMNSFRNIATAYETQNNQWLFANSIGTNEEQKIFNKEYSKVFTKNLVSMKGYAVYKNYVIIFAKQSHESKKFLFVLKKDDSNYKISTNFKILHPKIYNIIEQTYYGNGEFKIVKNK
jgi:hypothetical protein